jgi:two-component system sensor histidine kinase KdpD
MPRSPSRSSSRRRPSAPADADAAALFPLLARARQANALHAALLVKLKHELRTPFAAMSNALAMLERFGESAGAEKRARWVQLARGAAGELDHLLHALDDVRAIAARATQGTTRRVRGADVQRIAATEFRGAAATQLEVHDELPAGCVWRIDPVLLRHALAPVLANARLYSPSDTPVRLRLAGTATGVALEIVDQGRGVPAAEVERLFEPYYRATNARDVPGAGLGLTLARTAAEMAGGALTLHATSEGSGSTWRLEFPAQTPTE